MTGLTVFLLICGSLIAGAAIGLSAVGWLIAREARDSVLLVQAQTRARLEGLIGPNSVYQEAASSHQALDELRRGELDAQDALHGFQEGRRSPEGDAPRRVNGRPCAPCESARRAVLAARRAIFGP